MTGKTEEGLETKEMECKLVTNNNCLPNANLSGWFYVC